MAAHNRTTAQLLVGALLAATASASLGQDSMPGMAMPAPPATPNRSPAPVAQAPQTRQQHDGMAMAPGQTMPGMDMSGDRGGTGMTMAASTMREAVLNHSGSGTTVEPPSTPMPMLMTQRGPWMLMLHGNAFLADTQQHAAGHPASTTLAAQAAAGAPIPAARGGDKLFSTNWVMPMAARDLGPGRLTLRAMLSLEPATITGRQYPELFQQGETAFGKPIIDGQHPHDFVMELAAMYDWRMGERTLLSLYAAPVGDPAIGPTAYPHRLSASEDPMAALGHHQQDSTHIAFNVLTAGFTYRWLRLEESGFHGAEPTEARWHFEPSPNGHAIDSYSTRVTWVPSPNWAAQYSWAHITAPEALYPHDDQGRQTASLMYNRPFGAADGMGGHAGNLSATAVWGRTRALNGKGKENSYLAEALLQFRAKNYVWTRLENAGRSNELLLPPGSPLPRGFDEAPLGHVAAYTLGYDRDVSSRAHLLLAPGLQFTSYSPPAALTRVYGAHPFGIVAFVRLRLH